jgi:RsmE family RNA methyltransferase
MKHIPHLVVAAPWQGEQVNLSVLQSRHLTKVLRMSPGDKVSYTDGLGNVGQGVLGSHVVRRGDEQFYPRSSDVVVAAAPPASKDRQRFLVEKLAELGVARLRWLQTRHGKNRVASGAKQFAWVLAATEQSRGAWLMETSPETVRWQDLDGPVVVCHPGGESGRPHARTVVIGPEGGFAGDEIPEDVSRWDLGPTILRVETAAIVAASRLLG